MSRRLNSLKSLSKTGSSSNNVDSSSTTTDPALLSRRATWVNMPDKKASLARLDSISTNSSHDEEVSILEQTRRDILNPSRLAALNSVDVAPIPYNTYSFFSYILTIRGRNFSMMIVPLIMFFFWGLGWQLLFYFGEKNGSNEIMDMQEYLAEIDGLITPLLTPLSFLMTFRLGRAAIRFWDARKACGKMVEMCRCNIATVSVGIMSPIRLRKRHMIKQKLQDGEDQTTQPLANKENEADEDALVLLCEYARWLVVFPIAVKHFLRDPATYHWGKEVSYKKRRYEIGPLLSDEDAILVIKEYDDKDGTPTSDSTATRARDNPLVVLNRLHELAYDIAYFAYTNDGASISFTPTPQGQALLYQQLIDQINTMFGAYGAMERIKGTPLPYVYAIHLRTFLLVYLFLWNMSSVAKYGWLSLPFLSLLNWALLGIEAASVECERPFDYNPNHLTLGKVCVVVARNTCQALKELVCESITTSAP